MLKKQEISVPYLDSYNHFYSIHSLLYSHIRTFRHVIRNIVDHMDFHDRNDLQNLHINKTTNKINSHES